MLDVQQKRCLKTPLLHMYSARVRDPLIYFTVNVTYFRSHLEAIAPIAAPTRGLLRNFKSAG